jgi:hypothetical protein
MVGSFRRAGTDRNALPLAAVSYLDPTAPALCVQQLEAAAPPS